MSFAVHVLPTSSDKVRTSPFSSSGSSPSVTVPNPLHRDKKRGMGVGDQCKFMLSEPVKATGLDVITQCCHHVSFYAVQKTWTVDLVPCSFSIVLVRESVMFFGILACMSLCMETSCKPLTIMY